MDPKERAALIREANQAFNEGDYSKARKLYIQTDYKDGLIRMGDYFMYERKLPMLAYGYYKKAGYQKKIDEIFQRMLWALSQWLGKDKFKIPVEQATLPPNSDIVIHPILKNKALEILKKNGQSI